MKSSAGKDKGIMEKTKFLSKQKAYVLCCLLGCLFLFFAKTERDLDKTGNILWTAGYVGSTVLFVLIAGCLLGAGGAFILCRVLGRKRTEQARRNSISGRKLFFLSLFLFLLAWLPAYLAYYPGNCAYDTPIQVGQIIEHNYIDHHPIAHTLLIQGALWLGTHLFGSTNSGMALYTAFQAVLLAGSMAYGVSVLSRRRAAAGWIWTIQLLGMFFPFQWYMSVSVTKDTVFSAFLLVQLISLMDMLLDEREDWHIGSSELVFAVGTVGMVLFRNNGKYAMLVALFVLLLMFCFDGRKRKLWGRILGSGAAAFCVGVIGVSALFSITHAGQGDRREMLSIPIQQLARCMVYHGGIGVVEEDDDTMDETDRALINDFILHEAYKEYDPHIADPVKRHTNTYVVRYRYKDFFKTYFHLLAQYPGDMINAVLAVDAGFLSPFDETHATVNQTKSTEGLGYVQTRWEESTLNSYGIYKESKWNGLFARMEKWAEDNAYLKIPVLKYFFVPGSYLWIYLFMGIVLILTRKKSLCLPLVIVLSYFGTMLLGPTVQMRYIYPVMLALPFLIALSASGKAVNHLEED